MNSFAAPNPFENPLVLVLILLFGALSSWLMKRRQRNEEGIQSEGDELLPSSGSPSRPARPLDLDDALRRLLGGEPPPQMPPPPLVYVSRDQQSPPVRVGREEFQPDQEWMDEAQETYEAARPAVIQTAPPSLPLHALTRTKATRIEASGRHEQAVRRFEQLSEQGRHPATVVNTGRGRRSPESGRAVGFLRESRTVRQAFIASLVFAPPKGLEPSRGEYL